MAYSNFTLKEVTSRFQLHMEEKPDMFFEGPGGEVSALLQSLLQVYVPLALAIHMEKARSEFMIAPLLAEVLAHAPCQPVFRGRLYCSARARATWSLRFPAEPLTSTVDHPGARGNGGGSEKRKCQAGHQPVYC